MQRGCYLTGAFGQSQALYTARNEVKRGRASQDVVEMQILQDTKEVIQKQHDAGLDYIIDPMFSFYYLLQPFAEQIVTMGPQENWFNNNVFYWRPQIKCPIKHKTGFTEKYLHLDLLPKNGTAMVILQSPLTLLELSDITGYKNKKNAIKDIASLCKEEAVSLVAQGAGRIQYDEPALVYKQSLGSLTKEDVKLLEYALSLCGKIKGATTSLHTYFGDAGPLLPFLLDLPVDCIGIDATETRIKDITKYKFSNKELAIGLVDGRVTALEKPERLIAQLELLAYYCEPRALWLTPNSGTEYRGYTHSINKLHIINQVRRVFL